MAEDEFQAIVKVRNGVETSIHCVSCNRTSYHPMDVKHRFCGNCKCWHRVLKIVLVKGKD